MEVEKESSSAFKTPCKPAKVKSPVAACGTPVTIPASPFMKKLGCGTGVNVYLMNSMGKHTLSPWAIKKISSKCEKNQASVYQKRLCEEAMVLKELNHPNIVGFRAFTKSNDGSECLAMEFGGEQSLNDLIEKRREEGQGPFSADTMEKVALHVARGLQYLHNEKKLLHGDIKSCNVVIKGDFDSVKICDVGVSLPLDENMQALEGGIITDKADIFAYGLTLWEMMTLSVPHLEMLDSEDEDAYYEKLGTRPALDLVSLGDSYQRMMELFCLCTEENLHKRPTAAQIVQVLESNTQRMEMGSEVME
ncbi:hypothetical protein DNTS_008509 [Danionella cerebrum]|uniref:Protein kinase domain-containing protein n=1 Tax=Danionella cerebrum TaxID=2873325 RepID=A0A553QG91_9TELE|nr:hypothetical protein DNTS_008509 [Danionella translucida]